MNCILGKTYDIIFVGTTRGRVIKAINAYSADKTDQVSTVVIEELQVFSSDVSITDLKVMGGGLAGRKSLGRLAVMSDLEIRSLSVQRCDRATNCGDCVALQDPYCAWDVRASRCSSGDWTSNMAKAFLQAVVTGKHAQCPASHPTTSLQANIKDDSEKKPVSNAAFLYSYGIEQAPLGQIVNIVDNVQTGGGNSKQSRTTAKENDHDLPGSNDNSVQVSSFFYFTSSVGPFRCR